MHAGVAKLEAAACGGGALTDLPGLAAGALAAAMDQLALVSLEPTRLAVPPARRLSMMRMARR